MTNHPPEKIGWSYAYQLIWSDGMVESILAAVMPYLVAKRRQATIMLDLVHHKKSTLQGRNARGFARHPETVAAFRENLRRQMKELNAKGPSGPVGLHNQTVPAVSSSYTTVGPAMGRLTSGNLISPARHPRCECAP